jgi:hypothetical protein
MFTKYLRNECGNPLSRRKSFSSLAGWTFLSDWASTALKTYLSRQSSLDAALALRAPVLPIQPTFSSLDAPVRGFHFANFRQFCYETRLEGFIKPRRRQTNV